jgi:hypothetical protein
MWVAAVVILLGAVAGLLAGGTASTDGGGAGGTGATDDGGTGQASTADDTAQASNGGCEFWVAPEPAGDDDGPGTREEPWGTLEHAAANVPDHGCTVLFEPGNYRGHANIKREFDTETVFRSATPYAAVLEHDDTVVDIDGGRNITIEGFELRHDGPSTPGSAYVAIVDRRDETWSERITFRDNIFHDSHGDDLLKIHNGVRFATVENNVFYNQGKDEQHIDVNSVTDVVVQDNVFFNDFASSGRDSDTPVKHFIVVKDSNEDDDGLEGSERITIRRNVFLNWQGDSEAFVKIGNDGKPYHEARDVLVESNLVVGNSSFEADAAFGVRGARDVTFNNNTVVGDLPGRAFAYRIHVTDENPDNDDIRFTNNIWSDPTGTMGSDGDDGDNRFSNVDDSTVSGLVNDNNLYWNGDEPIPPSSSSSLDDPRGIVADPELPGDDAEVTLPYWTGSRFPSGNTTIRDEFVRLVETHGAIPTTSPAVDAADPQTAADRDILGRQRDAPDIGAYEAVEGGTARAGDGS